MTHASRPDNRPPDDETIGAATRAIAEATATLTKLLSKQVANVSTDVSDVIAASLREAAQGLADASASVERSSGGWLAGERRRARVDRTRADLIAAAGRVFAARGFEGASVGDIAAEAGYTKGALYAHFGSKSDLFVALARERLVRESPESDASTGDLAADLSAELGAAGADPGLMLALEILAYAVRHPESRAELRPLFDASIQDLAERVRDDRLARGGNAPDASSPAEEVTREDLDTALGLLAVGNVAAMFAEISENPSAVSSSGTRLITRLLAR